MARVLLAVVVALLCLAPAAVAADPPRPIHPNVVVPRFPCGIRRVRTEPPSVTAGTTALRYRTLIDAGL
jgi:hypothetical protein